VYDKRRLPTDAVLAVLSAVWEHLPDAPDDLGNARTLLRKYVWRAFLTDRYEQTAASRTLNDFRALRDVLDGEESEDDVPVFDEDEHPLPNQSDMKNFGWPKRKNIRARGLLALSLQCGARDIADGARPTRSHIKKREYHHLFPQSLLGKAGVPEDERNRALNCILITWKTNRTISGKAPMQYLKERTKANNLGEENLKSRLRTHLVPFSKLNVGGNSNEETGIDTKQLQKDYDTFLAARAKTMKKAISHVCSGRDLASWNGLRDMSNLAEPVR
jgi:hypothetical protein